MARKPNPNKNESKAEKFVRLAEARTIKAIKAIRALPALAGSGYESTEDQRTIVVDALMAEVERVKTAFSSPGKSDDKPVFSLIKREDMPE